MHCVLSCAACVGGSPASAAHFSHANVYAIILSSPPQLVFFSRRSPRHDMVWHSASGFAFAFAFVRSAGAPQ